MKTSSSGGESCFLVVDGAIQTTGHALAILPFWSPAGSRVACRVQTNEGQAVVCGEIRSPFYDSIGEPRFLDEDRIGFGARKGREIRWVVISAAN